MQRMAFTLAAALIACLLSPAPAALAQDAAADRLPWQAPPAPPGARTVPVRGVRVIDYGDDYIWHPGGDYFRFGPDQKGPDSRGLVTGVDVDGDGRAEGDCIAYLTFSMENPMNPPEPWWDSEGSNAVFYGGVTGFFPDNNGRSGFSELMINVHETPDGDNLSVHTHGTRERHRNYHVFLWKKEDFLKGGARRRVSTDEQSLLAVHAMRFWHGMDGARFVLLEGDPADPAAPPKFYISEYDFGNAEVQKDFLEHREGVVYSVNPGKTRWAEYDPAPPYDIVFEREKAVYRQREFRDVRAAGYYVAKHEWRAVEQGAKTYAFELYATVHRPERPSENLDMALIRPDSSGQGAVPAFYMSRCEIPYALWKKVRRPAVAQMFAVQANYPYLTDRDGDMGSMDFLPGGRPNTHSAQEPVTDITWLDAVAWCNMLSEYEGREPCYYFTPSFDTVFRRVRERRMGSQRDPWYVPRVYVKWDADGYRLPTAAEWRAAYPGTRPGPASAWVGANSDGTTHAVGERAASRNGLFDMAGNVWEYVWDAGEHYTEEEGGDARGRHVVMGGSFHYPADPWDLSGSRYGDNPAAGHFSIGFRVVRSADGARPPLDAEFRHAPAGDVPAWSIDPSRKTAGEKVAPLPEGQEVLEMLPIPESSYVRWDTAKIFTSPFDMARCEVSYAQWKRVYDWAVEMGYEFNKDGDMGSMDHRPGTRTHSPDEPVTDINRFDAIVWCNALSEMEGRKPCYYGGSGAEPIRKAHQYRRVWTQLPEKYKEPQFAPLDYNTMKSLDKLGNATIEVDWSTDGYRLPTMAEWIVACKANTTTEWHWGDDFADHVAYAWSADNSGGRTHPVGQLEPNPFGLHDMHGNVYEYCWGDDLGGGKQAFHETWNPKGDPEWRGERLHQVVRGGSFRYSSYWWRMFQPDGHGKPVRCFATKSYPEIGLRPVRCKARTHRRSGSEMPEDIQVLDVNLKEPVSPLQGQTHRGNLQRTGVHYTRGVRELKGLKWKFKTDGRLPAQPIVFRDTAYVHSTDGFLYAVDARNGELKWRYKTVGKVLDDNAKRPPAPTIKDGIIYLTCDRGYIYALDTRTGREKWKTTVRGAKFASGSPVPVYGAVFAFIGAWTQDGGFLAIHGETGQVLNIYRNDMWGAWQTWAFAEGNVIMTNHVGPSILNLRTGARRSTPNLWPNYNVPIVQDGRIYTCGKAVAATDYRAGVSVYQHLVEGKNWRGQEATAAATENAMALWNDTLYFGNRLGYLYAHDAATGRRIWKIKLGERIRSAPSVSALDTDAEEGTIYVGCDDGCIWALNAVDGEKLWSYETGAVVRSDPWIADGVVYFGSDDGWLYALE